MLGLIASITHDVKGQTMGFVVGQVSQIDASTPSTIITVRDSAARAPSTHASAHPTPPTIKVGTLKEKEKHTGKVVV